MWNIVDKYAAGVPEMLPEAIRDRGTCPRSRTRFATRIFPRARRRGNRAPRLAFDDFFLLQVGLAILRARVTRGRGFAMKPPGALAERLRASSVLLTAAQERVWREILRTCGRHPMHRLLQGDVGSARPSWPRSVLTAIEAGYQPP